MSTFNQILQGFKTIPTITVSIKDSDAQFELASPDVWLRNLTRERDRLIEEGVISKSSSPVNKRVFVNKAKQETKETENNEYFLGSAEKDIDFFIENVLCGWHNICSEQGAQIPFSKETAKEFFNPSVPEVYKLVSRLFSEAANEENFIDSEVEETIKK